VFWYPGLDLKSIITQIEQNYRIFHIRFDNSESLCVCGLNQDLQTFNILGPREIFCQTHNFTQEDMKYLDEYVFHQGDDLDYETEFMKDMIMVKSLADTYSFPLEEFLELLPKEDDSDTPDPRILLFLLQGEFDYMSSSIRGSFTKVAENGEYFVSAKQFAAKMPE